MIDKSKNPNARLLPLAIAIILGFVILGLILAYLVDECESSIKRDPWSIKEEESGWYYYINKDNDGKKYAVIIGLVDEEMECEELVVPEKLGGCNVTVFGTSYSNFGVETKYYKFDAENVECLIFNHKVSIMPEVFDNYNGTVICNFDVSLSDPFLFDLLKEKILKRYIDYNGMGGEVTTYALFWYRNMLVPKPKDPTRDGYVFDGWYTDSEYTAEWDFENDLVPGDMTLYAKWREQ